MLVYANINSGELYFVSKEIDNKVELKPLKCALGSIQINKVDLEKQYKTIEEYKKK